MDEIIHCYSRAMAIEDGELFDVSKLGKEAGIVFPVALTRAVWAGCVEVPAGVTGQDETGRLWDLISMLSAAIRQAAAGTSTVRFAVLMKNKEHRAPEPVDLVAVCGPGDDPRPVITVMFPDES